MSNSTSPFQRHDESTLRQAGVTIAIGLSAGILADDEAPSVVRAMCPAAFEEFPDSDIQWLLELALRARAQAAMAMPAYRGGVQ